MDVFGRQGDVVIRKQQISGELEAAEGLVVTGASSHPHVIAGRCLFRRDGRTVFVRVEVATNMTHAGQHKPVSLPPGDYACSPLRERGGVGDRAVED